MNGLKHPALIVIDVQEGFSDAKWGARSNPELEENLAVLLKHWRENRLPIFHVQHLSKNPKSLFYPGQPGVELRKVARPLAHEPLLQKHVHSAFLGTTLEADLRKNSITDIVLTGIASDHCVSTTTRMGCDLGFNCWIVSDATTAFDRTGAEGQTIPGAQVHAASLASLNGEFATVTSTRKLVETVGEQS